MKFLKSSVFNGFYKYLRQKYVCTLQALFSLGTKHTSTQFIAILLALISVAAAFPASDDVKSIFQ